jgi:hypothetical protein
MARFSVIGLTFLLWVCATALAQDQEVPLGDLARALRKAKAATSEERPVIDNDNLPVMMEKAESERLNGKPVFSVDPSGKTFRMTSPDGTCSISFDAKATALIATPYIASELPQDELGKLDGPANVHDGIFEVSLHNGTGWELKEILVGVTTVANQPRPQLEATALETGDFEVGTKFPDVTTLYHLRASAPPDSVTVFHGTLAGDLDESKEWHWAIVGARGIPPAAPSITRTDPSAIASIPVPGQQPIPGQPPVSGQQSLPREQSSTGQQPPHGQLLGPEQRQPGVPPVQPVSGNAAGKNP